MKLNQELGEAMFQGTHFNIYRKEIAMADGVVRPFETASCSDVVRVYPVDKANNILLIREYHYMLDKDILRSVSGQINELESPEEAAKRELQEEIGIEATRFELFATSRPIIKVDCLVYHFLAQGLHEKRTIVQEGELIEVVKYPVTQIPYLVENNLVYEDIIAFNLLRLYRKLSAEKSGSVNKSELLP